MTRLLSLRIVSTAALVLGLSVFAAAQSTVAAITFKNAGAYQPAALESIAGLHHGSSFTKDDLDKSAQTLLDTGLFDDVQFLTNGTPTATNITYTLTPTVSPLLPVQFTNFPWWTHDEIVAALQASVPIFNGRVPPTGSLRATIQAALEKLLLTKGVTATVTNLGASNSAIAYTIASPTIQLHAVNLTGVTPDMKEPVNKLTALLIGQRDIETGAGTPEDNLITAYKDAGYFDVAITGVQRTVSPLNAGVISIDYAATVQPGTVYRLSHFELVDSPLLSTEAFQKLAVLHPEDPAANYPLLASLVKMRDPYSKLGYITMNTKVTRSLDTATHHVAYTVAVLPGPQFHLHSVTTTGLPAQDTAKFQSTFPMKPGDIYDGTFLQPYRQLWAAQHNATDPRTTKTVVDATAHTIDLTVNFVAR